ncbi:MAG: cob(I)yrinic acid a,c-diamide adenosyltransferase [Pseudomonadota bacterium]
MLKQGLVQVYTGNDDRVNFAPMGLGLRASGHNLRTHMTCFFPHEWMEGAGMASILLKPNLVVEYARLEDIPPDGKWNDKAINEVQQSFQDAKKALLGKEFDIVVLNGINRITGQGIISMDRLFELINLKPDHVELVLTGEGASDKLIERADLVTEMVCHADKDRIEKDYGQGSTAPIKVVTGNGKGKTTYCLGKALFMSCVGIRSLFLQFIKSPLAYGEIKAIGKLPYLEVKTMGEGFLNRHTGSPQKKHLEAARRAWEECLRDIFSLKYGLIILDEINIATHYGLIHPERVKEMLFLKPEKLHLILSGRNAHPEVSQGATTVIEMKEIKHPFTKGIKARKGIEF